MRRVDKPCAVYHAYDDRGLLLYVGCSVDPADRMEDHRRWALWYPAMVAWSVQWYEDQETALAAEAVAIFTEDPRWNIYGRRRVEVLA